ncbi:MAG: DUF4920 domain-containing protein [Chitinophagaceae bacterium]|nr:DUF4920 domain-containing protein [Chitinophagaceae bacterium]
MKILAIVFSFAVIASCNNVPIEPKFYGQTFDTTQVITVADLVGKMEGQAKVEAVITGQITESCQAEGCWLNLKNEKGNDVFVDWDRQFNTPKNISGRHAMAKGYAYIDSTKTERVIAFKASGVFL